MNPFTWELMWRLSLLTVAVAAIFIASKTGGNLAAARLEQAKGLNKIGEVMESRLADERSSLLQVLLQGRIEFAIKKIEEEFRSRGFVGNSWRIKAAGLDAFADPKSPTNSIRIDYQGREACNIVLVLPAKLEDGIDVIGPDNLIALLEELDRNGDYSRPSFSYYEAERIFQIVGGYMRDHPNGSREPVPPIPSDGQI